ncbi:MAG: hypothetical protein LBV72_10035 [Tannerella sp.]|jgi:hypothetical protein|nr:hypothetical protein [Tannerella sp.]
MYGTLYTIPFKSLSNISYKVEILRKDYTGSSKELDGGDDVFEVNTDDEEFLYNPLRLSGATLKIVGSDYLQSLFSTSARKHKVNLKRENDIIWTGFITPEVYSQDYSTNLFEFEIECISALSTLEYVKFDLDAIIVSLFDLVKKAITLSEGDYKGLYVPCTFGTNTNVMKEHMISSDNFIDEDDERMTYKEILEEICRFYCWTLTEKNGFLYLIDIDYIKKGFAEYFFYNPSFAESKTTLSNDKQSVLDLTALDMGVAGENHTLDIISGYNKVNVVCSDYEVKSEDLFPPLSEDISRSSGVYWENLKNGNKWYFKELCWSKNYDIFQYRYTNQTFVPSTPTTIEKIAGGQIIRMTEFEGDDRPNELKWEPMVQVKLYDGEIDNSIIRGKLLLDYYSDDAFPLLQTRFNTKNIVFSNEQAIILNFAVCYSDRPDGFRIKHVDKDTIDSVSPDGWYIPISLRIGEWYYDGTTFEGKWSKEKKVYKLYTDLKKKTQHYVYDWLNVRNQNDYLLELGDVSGHIVWFNKQTIIGDIELTIYCPKADQDSYLHRYIFIKDIKLQSCKFSQSESESGQKNDTLYTNVVNEEFVSPLDDIELKITSSNDSGLAYSKVIHNNVILDKLHNRITNSEMKPEELIVNRVVNQYQAAKMQTTQILKEGFVPYQLIEDANLPGKDFILINEEIDYSYDRSRVTLMEVK